MAWVADTCRLIDVAEADARFGVPSAQLVFSMDRPEVYGPQAFRLTFAEAARRGIICGYKVIISVITSEMVTNELLSRGEVMVNGEAVRARQVANQIALRDAIEKCGVKKVFTFHSTVKSAQSFVRDGSEGVGTHLASVAADVRRLTSKSEAREQNDVLAELIQHMGERKGRGKGFDDSRFADRVDIVGIQIGLEALRSAVTTRCFVSLFSSWDTYFGKLVAFKERFGHCNIATLWEEDISLARLV